MPNRNVYVALVLISLFLAACSSSPGKAGSAGATGATGSPGDVGDTGVTGTTGDVGITGSTGDVGATGSTGVSSARRDRRAMSAQPAPQVPPAQRGAASTTGASSPPAPPRRRGTATSRRAARSQSSRWLRSPIGRSGTWSGSASAGEGSFRVAFATGESGQWGSNGTGDWIDQAGSRGRDQHQQRRGSWPPTASGQYLVAGSYGGDISTSTDFGVTWTDRTSSGAGHNLKWQGVASDASGQYLVAIAYGGDIWTSTNFGQGAGPTRPPRARLTRTCTGSFRGRLWTAPARTLSPSSRRAASGPPPTRVSPGPTNAGPRARTTAEPGSSVALRYRLGAENLVVEELAGDISDLHQCGRHVDRGPVTPIGRGAQSEAVGVRRLRRLGPEPRCCRKHWRRLDLHLNAGKLRGPTRPRRALDAQSAVALRRLGRFRFARTFVASQLKGPGRRASGLRPTVGVLVDQPGRRRAAGPCSQPWCSRRFLDASGQNLAAASSSGR